MEKIPAPYMIRMSTPWAKYATGTWHLARQGKDYTTAASNWTRAGRAWAKRHHYESRFHIESAGTVVRFIIARELGQAEGAPAPAAPAQHPGTGAAARDEWRRMTAVFMAPEEPAGA